MYNKEFKRGQTVALFANTLYITPCQKQNRPIYVIKNVLNIQANRTLATRSRQLNVL